jgi:deoxyhypusine synthase
LRNRYNIHIVDFKKIKTYPIKKRDNKVRVADFVKSPFLPLFQRGNNSVPPFVKGGRGGIKGELEDLFPNILKGNEIREVVDAVIKANKKKKPVIFAIGAHVIKCGLSPIIIDLMKKGIVTAVAMNGAGAIHDYEIAMIGETSEDVAVEIKKGRFGMVEETGAMMNSAINKFVNDSVGMGEALGRDIHEKKLKYKEYSILYHGYELKIPVTIHTAIGTEIIHMHPSADGAVTGKGSFNDFKLFTSFLTNIGKGGCFFNIGSAVILPEVFIKALSIVRNMGYKAHGFVTVNMDMVQHYRPHVNVVNRPIQGEGKGYTLTGHHEIMLPLIYQMIITKMQRK